MFFSLKRLYFPYTFNYLFISYSFVSMVINNYKKVFFAPNTSDQEIIQKAKKILVENGINENDIQINYNTNELEEGDLFISYDPPDLVVRNVYQKKLSGIIKMKSLEMLRLD